MPLLRKIAMPSFAEIRNNPSAVGYYFRRTVEVGAMISFAAFFGIASVAQTAVPLILGEKWAPSVWLMFAVCLGMPFSSLIGLYSPILQATGNHKLALSNTTIALILFTITFSLGALQGPLGLACAWAISFPILLVIITTRSAPRLHIRAASVYAGICAPLLAATVMLSANLLLHHLVSWHWHPFIMLTTQILVGAAIYLAALHILDGNVLKSFMKLAYKS